MKQNPKTAHLDQPPPEGQFQFKNNIYFGQRKSHPGILEIKIHNPKRLNSFGDTQEKVMMDVINGAQNDDKVKIDGKGLTTLNLDGFLETYKLGIIEFEIESEKLKISSLPAIVLLKLISFDDRPEERIKDAKDINSILLHYPNMETDLIWDEYNFLYDGEKSHQQVGTETLGYEIAKIIMQDGKLTRRVTNILKKAILKQSRLSIHMIENSIKETIEEKINLLKYLEFGIIEGIKK